MYNRIGVETIPTWVRTDRDQNILFEGSYEDALKFGEGNFMTKQFYVQYSQEMREMWGNNS
jgi:hypothetical protein